VHSTLCFIATVSTTEKIMYNRNRPDIPRRNLIGKRSGNITIFPRDHMIGTYISRSPAKSHHAKYKIQQNNSTRNECKYIFLLYFVYFDHLCPPSKNLPTLVFYKPLLKMTFLFYPLPTCLSSCQVLMSGLFHEVFTNCFTNPDPA